MTGPDFALSTEEFDILWGQLGFDRMPYPLDVPRTGRTMEERAELTTEVYRGLRERGLATGNRIDPDLEALLRLLASYHVAIDAVGHLGHPFRALVAADRTTGVLAVLTGGELWLTQIRRTALAMAIVGVLPEAAAGPGRSISVPYQAIAEAADPPMDAYGDPVDEHEVLTEAGLSPSDADLLVELADQRRAGGQFGVSAGPRERMSTLVTWFDTDRGRYLMVNEDSWVSIGPADNARIEQRVASVLSEVD
ncbi:ESX secretion-associated protein EspG [Amycolatopsis taiwanensis]|uniref:ESX secretion-associated protein EspG n=1 Tax=Amycolatopsis taiwanensis TaxID=342230 RepID=A0A9W6VD02_9PSEU|nr:ESX secretion-associated protein EspG [Amycolatopsis taiwanensis]GLY66743.1 ESX secretion-associated protein EspG [Amycolatopsis taiwanensis]